MSAVGPILGLILAGGQGRRMGGVDKALLPLAGKPLLTHVLDRLAPQCPAGVVLSANGDPGRFADLFDGPILPDPLPGCHGPLAGILAGMEYCVGHHIYTTHLMTVAADVPFIPRDLVRALKFKQNDQVNVVAIAASNGRMHYTEALWPISLHRKLRRLLFDSSERRVKTFVGQFDFCVREWPVTPYDPFYNVNSPCDLELANVML